MNKNKTAIYCRLSVEDGKIESRSIENQRIALMNYCKKNNLEIYDYYIDDGYTGTNLNRPAFNKLRSDILSKKIDTVITKDLSRLGRNYLEIGYLMEIFFPCNNIRYISISDNIDTKYKIDELLPFKNVINEMYVRDLSKKITSTINKQMKEGLDKKASRCLFGYTYENDKRIVDKYSAMIVQTVYSDFIKGYSLSEIAKKMALLSQNIINYRNGNFKYLSFKSSTIKRILTNIEYLGNYVRGKTKKVFKTNKNLKMPYDKMYIFKNKYEAIIDPKTFNKAKSLFINNKRNALISNPYKGLIYCGICGKPLRLLRHTSRGNYEVRLTCPNNKEPGKATILIDDLNLYMKEELKKLNITDKNYNDIFLLRSIINKITITSTKIPKSKKKQKNIIIDYKDLLCKP